MKMKSLFVWVLCFVLLFSSSAYADSSDPSWLEKGWEWFTEKTGLNVESVKESVLGWIESIEIFSSEIKNDPEVREAWNTLKDGALQAGNAGKEAVTKAYHTVLNWWLENSEGISQEAASILDRLAEAAGVDQAEIAEWYSTGEEYIAENKEIVTDGVQEAWRVIKEAGTEAGETVQKELKDAYQAVREWLETSDSEEAQEAQSAFGKIVNL